MGPIRVCRYLLSFISVFKWKAPPGQWQQLLHINIYHRRRGEKNEVARDVRTCRRPCGQLTLNIGQLPLLELPLACLYVLICIELAKLFFELALSNVNKAGWGAEAWWQPCSSLSLSPLNIEPSGMAEPELQDCHLGLSLKIRGYDFLGYTSLHIRNWNNSPLNVKCSLNCATQIGHSAYCRGFLWPPS